MSTRCCPGIVPTRAVGAVSLLGTLLVAVSAGAEEPRPVNEPSVLAEPGEITQVVDAFDDEDEFDLHLSLGFRQSVRTAKIFRETSITDPGFVTGGFSQANLNVAEYSETTSRLTPRADIGVYKDIALILRLPIILSNKRELKSLDGSGSAASGVPLALLGLPGEQLFEVPFESPTRSGIEYLAVGFDFGIMNQTRDASKPTWVVGLEGRFNVSEPMHACSENPESGQVECAHPSDINRDGVADETDDATDADDDLFDEEGRPLEGTFSGSRDAGVSRGVTALELHTYVSRRIKYIEPYAGFATLFEFQNESSDYGATDLQGSLVNHPPLQGTMTVGLNVIPWELRERYQRVTFDFRFSGTYVSEGRDYSELFDALGSSSARSLRAPNYATFQENPDTATREDPDNPVPSVVNPTQKVYFTGLTDVQQHGRYTFSTQFTWQAGQYVKFNLGGSYMIAQSHFLAFDQACNPDFASSVARAGPCRRSRQNSDGTTTFTPTGIPNPNYRRVINDPGRRFKVDSSIGFDAWLNATVMF